MGGGENTDSYKLPNPDSAHCEIMRLGCLDRVTGGVNLEEVVEVLSSGKILIPHMAITPSFVLQNKDSPPEIELKFELEPSDDLSVDQWPNWQLEFLHNQLFEHFQFPGRFCPGPFHMTFVRKAAFRSPEHRAQYLSRCSDVVSRWRADGPRLLTPECNFAVAGCVPVQRVLGDELVRPHGVYLFRHRMHPVHYFPPNFEPPYDTAEKRAVIEAVLSRKWDERSLEWTDRAVMNRENDNSDEGRELADF